MRKNNSSKIFSNLYKSALLFQIFNQKLYLRCILLQISLFEYYREKDSPIWQIFNENPDKFFEVKGEWSLAKITYLLQSKGLHLDPERASIYYSLINETNRISIEIEDNYGFFGYKKYKKKYNEKDEEVIQLNSILLEHLKNILKNQPCIYPKIKGYHYGKFSSIKLLTPEEFDEDENISLYKLNEDDLVEEISRTEELLLTSKSGHTFFQVEFDRPEYPLFKREPGLTDKVPGKILDHRIGKNDDIELLMKWKYLSYDEATWVLYIDYSNIIFVKLYYHKNISK